MSEQITTNTKKPVNVNVSELKQIANMFLKKKTTFAIRIDGEPGIGKSQIIKQIAAENKRPLVETRLAFKDNPELAGHMVPDREKGIAVYLRPQDIPTEPNTVWFLDEVNRVYHPSILQTLFQMITENKVGTHDLPEGTAIFLAGNLGDEDGTIITEFDDTALQTRYAWFKLEPQFTEWKDFAKKQKVNNLIISFLDKNKEYFERFKGRVWFQLNEAINLEKDFMDRLKEGSIPHRKFLESLASVEVINEFSRFIKEFNELDEKMILSHFSEVKGQLKDLDRERLFQLNQKILLYFEDIEKNEKIEQANKSELINVLKYSMLLDKDTASEFITKLFVYKKVLLKYQEMKEKEPTSFNKEERIRLRDLFAYTA